MSWRTRYAGLSRSQKILAGLALAALLWQGYRYLHRTPLMPHELNTVKQLTQPAKTVCLGRFLLDVPQTQADKIRGTYEIDGMRLEVLKVGADEKDLNTFFSESVQKINREKYDEETVAVNDIFPNHAYRSVKKINPVDNFNAYHIEFFKLIEDVLIGIQLKTFDNEQQIVRDIPRLEHLLTRLERLPRDGSLPKGAGFCAGQVWVKGTEEVSEVMEVSFDLPAPHGDALVELTTRNAKTRGQGLLDTVKKNVARYAQFGFSYTELRSGHKNVNGWRGEEVLARAPLDDQGGEGQKLIWKYISANPSVLDPQIKFEIETGNVQGNKTSLSDAVAVGVYDRILESLRLRPEKP